MSLNRRTVQSANQKQVAQATQGFTTHNANNLDPSTVMSVVVNDPQAQLPRRKTDLERYFQDQSVQRTEIEFLGIEKEQLLRVLQKLDPNAATRNWSIEDFQEAVQKTKREYEAKDRLFGGKPQNFFHKIIGKFGAHANLFKVIPQQTNYTSIVTGAATILVAASIQHTETIEELSRVLSVIDDEAAACTRDSEFYQSEFLQRAVAKFFIAVFLLLGDVAMWYQSSGWKRMRNSLHEGFKQQFEDALQNVIRLSGDIQRASQQGANAEVRVVRLDVQDLRIELRDIRAGISGELRAMAQQQWDMTQAMLAQQKKSDEQNRLVLADTRDEIRTSMSSLMRSKTFWREILTHAMPILKEEFVNAIRSQQQQMAITCGNEGYPQTGALPVLVKQGGTHLPSTEIKAGILKIQDLVEWSVPLLDYVQQGAGIQTLADEETPIFFDHRIVMALDEWLQADEPKLLYLESLSYVTAAALRIVLSAGRTDPRTPCASFFCRARDFDDEAEVQTGHVDPLLGVVYSLIYQILRDLPPLTEQTLITSKVRFTNLDGNLSSWDRALELLKDTLHLAPALIVIVIDGLLAFEEGHEYEMKDLINLLRTQMFVKDKVLKVLLTTDRMISSIMEDLDVDEMRILDANPRQMRGMIPFMPGVDADDRWDDEYD